MNDFGGKLRLARERRGISLQQISATTKISIAALEALERNDISKLPGGIFSRSFVRAFATEVGIDPDETVCEFLERFHGSPATTIPTPATASEDESAFGARQHVAGVVLKVVLVTVPVIVLILYFTMRVRPGSLSTGSPIPPSSSSTPPSPSPPPSKSSVASPADRVPTPVATTGATTAQPVDANLVLDVAATGDCWVKIKADGAVVVARLMHSGDKLQQTVRDSAVIQVGDAGAFAFSINGRPAKPLGPAGSVRTVTVSKDTLARYFQ